MKTMDEALTAYAKKGEILLKRCGFKVSFENESILEYCHKNNPKKVISIFKKSQTWTINCSMNSDLTQAIYTKLFEMGYLYG